MSPRAVNYVAQNLSRLQLRTLSVSTAARPSRSDTYYQSTLSDRTPFAALNSRTRLRARTFDNTEKSLSKLPRNRSKLRSSEDAQLGPLRENHVAIRVKELCTTGQLEEAMAYCINAPTALQGPVAWNTIIQAALGAKRYDLAYKQFLAMKKRAIEPTVSTYITFLTGYAQAEIKLGPIQLERAEKLYNDWTHLVSSGRANLTKRTARLHPAATYIDVLANAGAYQKIWDVFYDLEEKGSLAPNERVFTSMFLALAQHAREFGASPAADQGPPPAKSTTLLWRQVLRAVEKQPFPIDSHLITAALRALRHGGETEHELAFTIIGEHLGLKSPGAPSPAKPSGSNLMLDPRALDAVLAVCNSSKRRDLIEYYVEAIIHSPNSSIARAVNTALIDQLLSFYASSADAHKAQETIDWMLREAALPNGPQVKPGSNSWALAFRACANAKDWEVARTLLDRLESTRNKSSETKNWTVPSAETAYFILKVAYASQPADTRSYNHQLRTAFDVVEFVSRLWTKETYDPKRLAQIDSKGQRRLIFQNKLADLLEKIVEEFGSYKWTTLYRRIAQMRVELSEEVTKRHGGDSLSYSDS